jgi:lysophospholipase L1-like esterase
VAQARPNKWTEMPAESTEPKTQPKKRTLVRSFLVNVSVTLGGIVVALLLLELLLNIHNPFQARIKGNRIVLTTNKTYHIKNDIIKSLDPEITVTRNSLGFRGPNPPVAMDNYLSLVSIGGSTTQCFFLSDEQTWTARLAQGLETTFKPVWVSNAGLDGHSTHGHQVLLEDFIVPLHPKVALFLVGANDVARSSMAEWDAENVKSGIQFNSPKAFMKSLSAYSEVAALILNAYRSYTAYKAGLLHQQVDFKQQGYLDIPEEEQEKYLAENASPAYLADYGARLKRLVETCRKAGIEPVLITQALLVGFGTDDITGLDLARIKAYGPRQTGKMYWDVLEMYNDVTRRVGQESNILVIDLAKQMPKSSRYFYDFIHYTPEGAQVTAGILERSLCPMLQTKFPQYATQGCSTGN